jgi:hypothetical protein
VKCGVRANIQQLFSRFSRNGFQVNTASLGHLAPAIRAGAKISRAYILRRSDSMTIMIAPVWDSMVYAPPALRP